MSKEDNVIKFPKANARPVREMISSAKEVAQTLEELSRGMIVALLECLRQKDAYTWGHSLRVAFYCRLCGQEMGLTKNELFELEISGLMHDIGKIGTPDGILKKPQRLDEDEFLVMKQHPDNTYDILKDLPLVGQIAKNCRSHHERYDGRGYPDKLKGEDIPLFSRIILIADTFDAMTSTRPYRKGMDYSVAFAELNEFAGEQFDPRVVEFFIKAMERERSRQNNRIFIESVGQYFEKESAA